MSPYARCCAFLRDRLPALRSPTPSDDTLHVDTLAASPAKSGGIATTVARIQRERVLFAAMRIAFVFQLALVVLSLAWLVPWVPLGMTVDHYGSATAIGFGLLLASSISSMAFLAVWGPFFAGESVPEFVRVLFGANLVVRGRQQFYHRLREECEHARGGRGVFSVIIVELAEGVTVFGAQARQHAVMLVRSAIRTEDVLGDIAPTELAVLSRATDEQVRSVVIERLARTLVTVRFSSARSGYRLGGATFRVDGLDPDELLDAARRAFSPAQEHQPPLFVVPAEPRQPQPDGDLPTFLVQQLERLHAILSGPPALPPGVIPLPLAFGPDGDQSPDSPPAQRPAA